jgi:hypothetical protein
VVAIVTDPSALLATLDEEVYQRGLRTGDPIHVLREQRDRAFVALREIHEYHCGCEAPGALSRCVAQPVLLFALLAP